MKHPRDDYLELLKAYLAGSMTAEIFRHTYLKKFKTENEPMGEELFGALDELFGDIDAFCSAPTLLADLMRAKPGWYLDEKALRGRVEDAVKRIEGIAAEVGQPGRLD